MGYDFVFVAGAIRAPASGTHLESADQLAELDDSCVLSSDAEKFSGDLWTIYTGSIIISYYRGSAVNVTRPVELTRDLLGDRLRISMPISGTSAARQGNHRFDAEPGNAAALRFDKPFTIQATSETIETVEIYVPMTDLAVWGIDVNSVWGRTWPLSSRSIAIRDLIASTLRAGEPMSSHTTALFDSTMLRFALLILDDGFPREFSPTTGHEQLRVAALSVIETQCTDPDLTPETVASILHTSVRSLYRAFEETGTTVGNLIREKRLERSAMTLARSGPTVTIASVARGHGFNGADQFSRAFRRRFGVTPQEFRVSS